MKLFAFYLVGLFSMGMTPNLYAKSIDCSTANQSLSFHTDSPNGGAPRPPVTHLTLNNETLIDVSFPGGHEIHVADYAFSSFEKEISKTQTENFVTTLSVKKMSVTQLGSTLFDDYVFCETTVYVGMPIP